MYCVQVLQTVRGATPMTGMPVFLEEPVDAGTVAKMPSTTACAKLAG